jgi:hypothetical protein
MKALCVLICFGLIAGGCEGRKANVVQSSPYHKSSWSSKSRTDNTASDEEETQENEPRLNSSTKQNQREDVCPIQGETVIDLNVETPSFYDEVVARKDVSSRSHFVMATAYTDGDEAHPELYLWALQNNDLATFTSLAWNNNLVEVNVSLDLFDNDGTEPESPAMVCAIDSCYANLGCQWFTVTGLVDLEGVWLLDGDLFPSVMFTTFIQKGRVVLPNPTFGNVMEGALDQDILFFEASDLFYTCTLTSRTHCDGVVSDRQTGHVVGKWTAYKQ